MKVGHDGLARGLLPEVAAPGQTLPVHSAVIHEAELEHAVGENTDQAGAVVALVTVPGRQGNARTGSCTCSRPD